MDVPGGQVQTHIHAVLGAGGGKLRQNVSLTVLVAGSRHIVVGVGAVPDTEAVMVLGCDDEHLEAGIFQGTHHGICVKILFQLENLVGGFVSVIFAPLDFVEGVGAEVAECGQLRLLVPVLVGIRHHGIRLRRRGAGGGQVTVSNVPGIRRLGSGNPGAG